MTNITDLKVTTEVLWKGALTFALIDVIFVSLVIRFIKPVDFLKMKWSLILVMALFFCILFGLIVSFIFWDSVYSYVFPTWMRWIIPPTYGLLFAFYGHLVWRLSIRAKKNHILSFSLFGGLFGIITHLFAIYRGILEKPPMLQGSSPFAALVIASFEFIFYWCVCLSLTFFAQKIGKRLLGKQ